MATIEPRLIHLLNDSTSSPQFQHADRPPLHLLPLPASAERERPFPPIDLDTPHRPVTTSTHPLRLLMDRDATKSPGSRTRSFNELGDVSEDTHNKKRGRNAHIKDDFVQLPQPMKRQKSAQQAPAMPPIINGLLEPPPHAALFPPMASSSYSEVDSGRVRPLSDFALTAFEDRSRRSPEAERGSAKTRKRATKPRRKWSEEETKHLLLGVNRHGVGKWTSILDDPDFVFDGRTAGDLKDRFRTCCPEELRSSSKSSSQAGSPRAEHQETGRRPRTGLHSENILIEDSPSSRDESDSTSKPRRSRAHRKKLQDLADMGIHGPFKKSHRRERRPFTEQDDREILEGLDIYGPAWTKIQRDGRFSLSSRQPTDLRDRVRNKYPNIYQRIEKGTFHSKDSARGGNVLEPSVNMSIDGTLKSSKASNRTARSGHGETKEDQPAWPHHAADTISYMQPAPGLDLAEANGPHFMGGEMDIARLLLDDSRIAPASSRRHGAEYSPGSLSPPPPSSDVADPRVGRHGKYQIKC
ncbi:MYB DNA-binding domain containing protein [Moelleriella libera RCEF 2490]|uniref:MYB DNA-binding domain containing protein n=1 Tax=Moelleriella libera RCEF 2490 TaxID=1081109 RepID=A0A167ZZL3_9HYPO|nr:MYB DNA-binding domain containing protein [Moelleriella libera RCEF 2490]